ncbi:helix-turn-helix domain-containing protein [Vibrio maerlii]|uniref:helix-turn-helix domain-containing protein n=1 Tax=Vibrio maerlii TaxID=2231648 RepID=UPI000E3E7C2D|nr:AraC family transcriptional regulator [Vibrio maerlii]
MNINTHDFNVPTSYLLPVVEACQKYNIDTGRLLAKNNLSTSVLTQKSAKLDILTYASIINTGALWTHQDNFGAEVGQRFTIEWARELSYLIARQDKLINIYPALEYLMDAQKRGIKNRLEVSGEVASHIVDLEFDHLIECDQLNQLIITYYHKTFKSLLNDNWKPFRVTLRKNDNADIKSLERYFGCSVIVGSERNAIDFPRTLLNTNYSYELDTQKDILSDISKILKSADFLEDLIKKYIQANLEDGYFSKEHIARMLCIHPRVLQTLLSDRGLTYRGILEDVRKNRAMNLLKNTDLSITIISGILGYENSRTFIHAFKNWTKLPPNAWRITFENELCQSDT